MGGRLQSRHPHEAFDFIVTDECHRSIYGLPPQFNEGAEWQRRLAAEFRETEARRLCHFAAPFDNPIHPGYGAIIIAYDFK